MSHKSFISEKQVTQFIVNSYDLKNKEVHKLGFGGGSSLYLLRENLKFLLMFIISLEIVLMEQLKEFF